MIYTKNEWYDSTVNLWSDCTKVHQGDDANSYADSASEYGKNVWYDAPRVLVKTAFRELYMFQELAEKSGATHRVFCGSMMDVFEKSNKLLFWTGEKCSMKTGDVREQLFYMISEGYFPNLMFLFLTKRPLNINKHIPLHWKINPPDNVMFGTSPVDQKTFDTLVPQLLAVNGKKFLSIAPQLAPIRLPFTTPDEIGWIIQGGESGHGKRPFDIAWARSVRDQCGDWGIPYFLKSIDKVQEIPNDLKIR